jgi:hypothetical protein
MRSYFRRFLFLVVALAAALGLNYASAAWSNPTATPPGGNIDVPVNVGNNSQTKQGNLILNSPSSGLPYATGLVVANGNVGIGTASPTEKLQIGSTAGLDTTLRIDAPNTQHAAQVEFAQNGTPNGWVGPAYNATDGASFDVWSTANSPMVLGTSGIQGIRIDPTTGNVRIGTDNTTSIPQKLQVGGNVVVSGSIDSPNIMESGNSVVKWCDRTDHCSGIGVLCLSANDSGISDGSVTWRVSSIGADHWVRNSSSGDTDCDFGVLVR